MHVIIYIYGMRINILLFEIIERMTTTYLNISPRTLRLDIYASSTPLSFSIILYL